MLDDLESLPTQGIPYFECWVGGALFCITVLWFGLLPKWSAPNIHGGQASKEKRPAAIELTLIQTKYFTLPQTSLNPVQNKRIATAVDPSDILPSSDVTPGTDSLRRPTFRDLVEQSVAGNILGNPKLTPGDSKSLQVFNSVWNAKLGASAQRNSRYQNAISRANKQISYRDDSGTLHVEQNGICSEVVHVDGVGDVWMLSGCGKENSEFVKGFRQRLVQQGIMRGIE